MPRYHFNVRDGQTYLDEDGLELADHHAARVEALRLAAGLIRDAADRADLGEEWCIEVTDDAGLMLFRMDFVVAESSAVKNAPSMRRPTDATRQ